jgi:ferrochelatase
MKRGFLLMNTGSPEAPTEAAVRVYLKEFLMDPYVIDLPFPLRYALVHWAILPKRPAESAKAYQSIWTEQGSPLVHYGQNLCDQLRTRFTEPVELGMAYGQPSFRPAVEKLLAQGVDEICLLPMFPHYAMATTGGCTAVVKKEIRGRAQLRVVPPFYQAPTYIQPLAESLKNVDEHILFSYHGLPERHLKKTDPTGRHCLSTPDCCETGSPAHATCYRHQCFETTRAIVAAAGLEQDRYSMAFQSRLGRAKWLEPYTDQMLAELPAKGIQQLAVICPAFLCDCLETLEEIEIRGRETFMEAGGKAFRMIPCLNDSAAAALCLQRLMDEAGNWPKA